jgi:putative ABC transport system substrate-binding protein
MRRREFVAGLFFALSMRQGWAQQRQRVSRIALAEPFVPITQIRSSFGWPITLDELNRLGFIEGQNLNVELYSANGDPEQYAQVSRDVVRRHPDLIVTWGVPLTRAFKSATDTIPVVTAVADPVAFGLAESLARPGSNITGVSVDAGLELWGKRLELLKEAVPNLSTASFLASRPMWEGPQRLALQEAAQRKGISLLGSIVQAPAQEEEYRHAFAEMPSQHIGAVIVSSEGRLPKYQHLVVALAENGRLPAIYPDRAYVGGLMIYGVDIAFLSRYAAHQIDQILRGADPATIPFYQPTKFELIINLKSASTLGITIPPALLARADEVIE